MDPDHISNILDNDILPFVAKPGRYIGNEVNVIKKDLASTDVTFALVFPDVYEMGMSYLGFQILYHILNKLEFVAAERAYAPWLDMEERMRQFGVPLFTLESKEPVNQFDVIGFTMQYELHYSNILNLIDMSGLPVEAKQRQDFPLVMAGGPCAFNPEPLAEFIDAFVIGDAEELAPEIAGVIRDAKQGGLKKKGTLKVLGHLDGVYVPEFYEANFSVSGDFESLRPVGSDTPPTVRARTIDELKPEYFAPKPLVPMIETTHDRISLEIARGCTRGCRFCNAGFIYRPVRERSVSDLVAQARTNISNTGYDEISLVSLSTSDYSQLNTLMSSLRDSFRDSMVSLSFPSLRPERFTPEVASFARDVRKSGLTLAPEAGTQRLREVINKTNRNEDLLTAVDLAFRSGWKLVKLYFMLGLPSETDEDLAGIVKLVNQVNELGRLHGGRRVNVSLSPFVPKSHTPFQWCAQVKPTDLKRKIDYLCARMRSNNVRVSWRGPETANLEGVLARGDRRVGKVIKRAWESGARFDAWTEQFKPEIWEHAFGDCDVDPNSFLGEKSFDAPLPWDHIDKGVKKKFLTREYFESVQGKTTEDCKDGKCNACGLVREKACQDIITRGGKAELAKKSTGVAPQDFHFGRGKKRAVRPLTNPPKMARMRYRKAEEVRFLSHLDMLRLLERSFRRAKVPIVYSEGFNPHPKIAFGPPLATGYTSDAEFLDFQYRRENNVELNHLIASALPIGVELLELKPLFGKGKSLTVVINRGEYELYLPASIDIDWLDAAIADILAKKEIMVERVKGDTSRTVDIRPYIVSLQRSDDHLQLITMLDNGQTVRVDEVLHKLFKDDDESAKRVRVNRAALWIQHGAMKVSPMEV